MLAEPKTNALLEDAPLPPLPKVKGAGAGAPGAPHVEGKGAHDESKKFEHGAGAGMHALNSAGAGAVLPPNTKGLDKDAEGGAPNGGSAAADSFAFGSLVALDWPKENMVAVVLLLLSAGVAAPKTGAGALSVPNKGAAGAAPAPKREGVTVAGAPKQGVEEVGAPPKMQPVAVTDVPKEGNEVLGALPK